MKRPLTILFSSAGRRVELMKCFREDARQLGVELRVLAIDRDPARSAACHLADHAYAAPRCTAPEFVPFLRELCEREKVALVIPTIDPELAPLAAIRDSFAQQGTRIAVSDTKTIAMVRDKLKTAEFLTEQRIPSPKTIPLAQLLAEPMALGFPLILKRIDGSSSVGLREAATVDDLAMGGLDVRTYIAQEKWIGREYTVNMFFDEAGKCRAIVPHLRREVRGGEVSKGVTERNAGLLEIGERLAAALGGARGAICFQAIVTDQNDAVVFEINGRFGGGFPLAHHAGAPFSRWLLEEVAGLPCTASNAWEAGVTMLRYDASVFVMKLP